MELLLDTNTLLIPLQFKLDIYSMLNELLSEPKLIILKSCVNELYKVKPKLASTALKIGFKNNLIVIETVLKAKSVDDEILSYARQHNCLVFTQDALLRKKLLKYGLRVIIMRQKRYLELRG